MPAAHDPSSRRAGLILPGGGARGAYQVGVLGALSEILPGSTLPFPVVCGISAGAINAGVVASHADDFPHAVARLEHFWGGLRCEQVYRTGWRHNLATGLHWLAAMTLGGLGVANPRSLLDNRPLARLLERELETGKLAANLDQGYLHALVITASGYATNRAVNFFQAESSVAEWAATRQVGRRAAIDHRHLLASAALPLLFPAQRLGNEFYGDGGLRQTAPLNPALRLGVDRLLVIGTRDELPDPEPLDEMDYPSLGEIGGYLLDVIFMDHLTNDLVQLERNNRLAEAMPEEVRGVTGMRQVDTLLIRPSVDMREIARRHMHRIPASVRALLRGVGVRSDNRLAGYLLFEAEFCRELMALGRGDALAVRDEIIDLYLG
jgi:NTE family protein